MASWGDINASLNRLVREGVIRSFRTNRADKSQAGLHVSIVPGDGADPEAVRSQIVDLLSGMDDDVTVTLAEDEPASTLA